MDFIYCNGHTIHYSYLDTKSKRTFLFINSLGTDFRIWDDVVEKLKAYGNILLYDKRGHGLSDFAVAKKGLTDYAEDVASLLHLLKIKNTIVIGISVGGMIAQLLSYHHPKLIEKLILCDTANKIGTMELWNERIRQVNEGGIETVSGFLMKRWFAPSFHEKYPEKVAGYKNMLERCHVKGYIQTCKALRDADITQVAKNLITPALCIVGSEDLSTTPEEVKSLSRMITDSKFEIIYDSAHIPPVDNTETFCNLIIDFIK